MKLEKSFFAHDNVVEIARNLLGKVLFSSSESGITAGIICETEAYNGIHDKACHAFNNRRTPRTEIMFGSAGHAYIYLCYGMHDLFNIVTGPEGNPQAVLIRGIIPYRGMKIMESRRKLPLTNQAFANGPGKVTIALEINRKLNGISLLEDILWLEDIGVDYVSANIHITPRIGVDYAGSDALLPYRFVLTKEMWKSEISKYSRLNHK